MPKWKQIRVATTALLMLVLLYFIYFASTLINHTASHEHLNYLPDNAEVTIILNTRKMVEQGLEDLMINTKDESVYDLLIKAYRDQEGQTDLPTGIDYTAHLAVFTIQSKELVSGLLFSLSDPNSFEANMPKVINRKNEVAVRKGNVGILLHRLGTDISAKEMKVLADSILSIRSLKNDTFFDIDPSLPVVRLRYRSQGDELDVDLKVENKKLSIEGKFHSSTRLTANNFNELAPKGLHISTTMIPEYFSNPENVGLPTNIPMPLALSANIRGSELSTGAIPIIPDADVVFYFKEKVPLRLGLLALMKDDIINNLNLKSFSYNGLLFYYKQLEENSFYVGRRPYSRLQKSNEDQILKVSGSLEALTDIHAEGMMSRVLSLLTMYTAGKTFTDNTERFELTMVRTSVLEAKVSGELTFKEGKYSTMEFVRLLLSGNFF